MNEPTYITIDGFEQLTKQQLFDTSLNHIRITREPSMTAGGAYCTYQGKGCAAAPFIKPEHREFADTGDTELKTAAWSTLVHKMLVPNHERDLVQKLQQCHDLANRARFMQDYERRMADLAEQEGLKYEPEKA